MKIFTNRNREFFFWFSIGITLLLTPFLYRLEDLIGGLTDKNYFVSVPAIIKSSSNYHTRSWKTSGHKLSIVYEYEFGEKSFVSDKYSFGQSLFSNKHDADFISKNYDHNQMITVYVNRYNPSIAVIDLDENQTIDFILLFLLLVVIVLLLFRDVRKRWKKEDMRKARRTPLNKSIKAD